MRDSRKIYGRRALMRLLAVASAVSYSAGFWAELAEKKQA
ncbi:Uncharacterised protein [Klebsiella pneumoniae]|nr:Uncharacterised protein [Klebsiella pneumoniae]